MTLYAGTKKDFKQEPVLYLRDLEKFRDGLILGKEYDLIEIYRDCRQRKIKNVKRMKLVEKGKHYATFENNRGTKETFLYWEIMKLIVGEEYT